MPADRPTPDGAKAAGPRVRERVFVDRVRAAFLSAGVDDPALAEELVAAVFLFARRDRPDADHDGVEALIEGALRDAGHPAAARAYADDRARRARVTDELVVIKSVGDSDPSGVARDSGGTSDGVEGWCAETWARRIAKESDLPPPVAEEIVDAAERRLAALGLKTASERLVREILQAEMEERRLVGDVAERDFSVTRRAVAKALASDSEAPQGAVARPVLLAAAVDELPEALRRARREGLVELRGLDRAPALERIEVPSTLLFGRAADDDLPSARLLLRARLSLERLRAHVCGVVALVDCVGRLARAAAVENADPAAVAEDVVAALDFSNAFGRADGPVVELVVPWDGFSGGPAGDRERAFVGALIERLAASRSAGLRVAFSTDGSAADDPWLARLFPVAASILRADAAASILVRRSEADDPFMRRPEAASARKLGLSPLRAALNLPLALFGAREGGVKDALEHLRAPLSLLTDAFHDALWRQRRGAPFGVHGVVVLFGGPAEVAVEADGQEADLELWGLPLALDLLARRGIVTRAKIAEAAARILNFAEFVGSEERSGLVLRPRVCGVMDRETSLRFHGAVDAAARTARDDAALAALKRPRGGEGVLPVVAPFFDPSNRALLSGLCSPRLGPGLAISESALPEGLAPSMLRALVSDTRLSRVSFAPLGASEGLFEVQEELFS